MKINKIEVRARHCDSDGNPEPGRYFLALITDENHGNAEHYRVGRAPFHTNRSGEVRFNGWCGTTDNVCVDACGAVEIYRDKAGRVRARRIDAAVLFAEVLPNSGADLSERSR